MSTVTGKMTAIANEIRELSGTTEALGLDAMATKVGDANDEIAEQVSLLAEAVEALEGKAGGGGGVTLPDLNNPGTASDLLYGKQLIDEKGEVITGTIISNGVQNLFVNGATITTTAGYYPEDVYQTVAKETLATPDITINTSGLITSIVQQQNSGYINAGYKINTKQLTTQAAKTITPSTSSQVAVASGIYTTGAVTVKGDSNLVAGNIKTGISIFGVTGSYIGGTPSYSTVHIISSGTPSAELGQDGDICVVINNS